MADTKQKGGLNPKQEAILRKLKSGGGKELIELGSRADVLFLERGDFIDSSDGKYFINVKGRRYIENRDS